MIKVSDFSKSVQLQDDQESIDDPVQGSDEILSPEMKFNYCGHSFEVDLWALGVIMYTMLFGYNPFENAMRL